MSDSNVSKALVNCKKDIDRNRKELLEYPYGLKEAKEVICLLMYDEQVTFHEDLTDGAFILRLMGAVECKVPYMVQVPKNYVLGLWKEGKNILFPVLNKKLINFAIVVLLGVKPDVLVVGDDVWESVFFNKYVYHCDGSA